MYADNHISAVHNDFRQSRGIFPLFDDLQVPDLDKEFVAPDNTHVNGVAHTNGVSSDEKEDSKREDGSAYDVARVTKTSEKAADEEHLAKGNNHVEDKEEKEAPQWTMK